MICPPKPTVLLELSGWKFYYGTAIFLSKKVLSGGERWADLLKMHKEKAEACGAKWFFEHHAEMCEKGVDEDFGKDPRIMKATGLKDPPFFGTVSTYSGQGRFGGIDPGMVATTGLDTDAYGRVLNSEFKPIKGLNAAGNNAGGASSPCIRPRSPA